MIIRMTVKDSDKTYLVENFASVLFERVYWTPRKPDGVNQTDWLKIKERTRELLNPNLTVCEADITDKDRVILEGVIYSEWCNYLEDDDFEDDLKKYLKKNFAISVGFAFRDQWENHEAVYYFTANKKWITQ